MLPVFFLLVALCTAGSSALSQPVVLTADQKTLLQRHVVNRYPFPTRFKWTEMKASASPMPLPVGTMSPAFRWRLNNEDLTLDMYLSRQPVTALLIAKDGRLLFERYQYGANAQSIFLSNSMAKSLTGLTYGFLQSEGWLPNFDRATEAVLPDLKGLPMGETTLRNHLRMGSGVAFRETSEPGDDLEKLRPLQASQGQLAAIKSLTVRERPQGERFNYMGPSSATLSLAAQAITGQSVARYLGPRLWERIGMEHPAVWQEDVIGATLGQCCLYARARDYLRLGLMLANEGRDLVSGQQIVPRDFLMQTTDMSRLDPAFAPRAGAGGYENQFWLLRGPGRQFALSGVYGQQVFIHSSHRLVMVHLAVNETAYTSKTSMGRERQALWDSLVGHFSR